MRTEQPVLRAQLRERAGEVIEQRLRVVLEVADQAFESHPNRSTRRVF